MQFRVGFMERAKTLEQQDQQNEMKLNKMK